jgi:predicted TIM-barrel fold metal-dependent hydrolase
MRVDVHAHLWTNEYLDLIEREGPDYLRPNVRFLRGLGGLATDDDLSRRFDLMDEVGLDLQVLSPAGVPLYTVDEAQTVRLARYANDLYAGFVERHPDRFRAFAMLPLPYVDAALAELERAFDSLGMDGVTLMTSILDRPPTDPSFDSVWEALDARNAIVFFHPAGVAAGSAQIRSSGLTWNLGATVEDTLCAAQLLFAGIPVRYPKVRIIIAHLGGSLPMVLYRLDDQPDPAFQLDVLEPPSEMAKRLWYDTISHGHPAALKCAVDSFGAERLVLGTDFPFIRGDGARRAVEYVNGDGLPDPVVRQILDVNAARLFGFDQ